MIIDENLCESDNIKYHIPGPTIIYASQRESMNTDASLRPLHLLFISPLLLSVVPKKGTRQPIFLDDSGHKGLLGTRGLELEIIRSKERLASSFKGTTRLFVQRNDSFWKRHFIFTHPCFVAIWAQSLQYRSCRSTLAS